MASTLNGAFEGTLAFDPFEPGFGEGEFEGPFDGEGPFNEGPFGEAEFESAYGEGSYGEDQFIGDLISKVKKVVRSAAPVLKTIAPIAARAVAGAVPGLGALTSLLGEEENEAEWELGEEFDTEDEDESFETLGEEENESGMLAEAMLAEAARAATDTEAAALAGGITITITGPAPLAVRRVAPVISRGTANIVRVLRRSPRTRPLTPVAGAIARSTARVLSKRASSGGSVTPA